MATKSPATKSIAPAMVRTNVAYKGNTMSSSTLPVTVHILHCDGTAEQKTMTASDAAAYMVRWINDVKAITVYR